jgi:hypothetical protein
MNPSLKKIILANVITLILAVILILLEQKVSAKLFWLSLVAIVAFLGTMLWAVITFLIKAFR